MVHHPIACYFLLLETANFPFFYSYRRPLDPGDLSFRSREVRQMGCCGGMAAFCLRLGYSCAKMCR
jgi:hypothetical protein